MVATGVFLLYNSVPWIQPEVLRSGANSVSALITQQFDEAGPFRLSALMAAGLALFALLSWSILARLRSSCAAVPAS